MDLRPCNPALLVDLYELTMLLRIRFRQRRIDLVAHSWGTLLGLVAVRQHRENIWRADGPAVRASWVGVYERLLADPDLAAIHPLCRRQWARANVSLADRHRGDGHYRAAFGSLLYAARPGLALPVWWRALAKTLLRPIVPAWARRLRRGAT